LTLAAIFVVHWQRQEEYLVISRQPSSGGWLCTWLWLRVCV